MRRLHELQEPLRRGGEALHRPLAERQGKGAQGRHQVMPRVRRLTAERGAVFAQFPAQRCGRKVDRVRERQEVVGRKAPHLRCAPVDHRETGDAGAIGPTAEEISDPEIVVREYPSRLPTSPFQCPQAVTRGVADRSPTASRCESVSSGATKLAGVRLLWRHQDRTAGDFAQPLEDRPAQRGTGASGDAAGPGPSASGREPRQSSGVPRTPDQVPPGPRRRGCPHPRRAVRQRRAGRRRAHNRGRPAERS